MIITTDIINTFMQTILTQIDAGYALVMPNVIFLFRALLIITIIFHGIRVAYADEPFFNALMMKILYVGFFVYLITNWKSLAEVVAMSFTMLGLKAGGSTISLLQFMNPGAVAKLGYNLFYQLLTKSIDLSSVVNFFTNLPQVAVFFTAGIIVQLCFFIMAIQVFMAVISFKLVTLAAFVLIPFGLWRGTGFLAERSIGYVFSAGIRLMALAVVISLGQTLFINIVLSPDPTIQEALGAVLGSLTFLVFSFYGPSLASDLVTGGPSLGAGSAFATAATAAVGMGAAARAFTGAANTIVNTVNRISTQQKADQIAQAAGAGMGGGGIHGGFRPQPPSPGPTGGSGGSSPAAPRPTVTAADMARHYDPDKNTRFSGGGGTTASTLTAMGSGGSGSTGETGGSPLRGEGKTPAARSVSTNAGSDRRSGGYSTASLTAEMRATRDGDGGGGMQPSIKHPDEET